MSDSASRRALASAAARLATHSALPAVILYTDDVRLPDPVAAARQLPKGAAVIVRSTDPLRRLRLAQALRDIARLRGLFLLIADDVALALKVGADGVHLPEAKIGQAAAIRARHRLIVTAAAHSLRALAKSDWVDALILSPTFPTASHPGKPAFGAPRANLMVRQIPQPVFALGGITPQNAKLLHGFCGIAAIGALAA